jgi:hypothetical protein
MRILQEMVKRELARNGGLVRHPLGRTWKSPARLEIGFSWRNSSYQSSCLARPGIGVTEAISVDQQPAEGIGRVKHF